MVWAAQHGKVLDSSGESPLGLNDDQAVTWLCDSIRTANTNIVDRAANNPELRGMGTTMTLAFVRGTNAIIAHVGDSRAYLIDGHSHRITQITADHSFVEALVAAGHLTHEQAEEHPMRNVLYRALGQNDEVDVDVYEAHLRTGDRLVLCSDGLTRHVKANEIATIAMGDDDLEAVSQALIDLANARGGEDNVSVIVIAVEGEESDEDTAELKNILLLDDHDLLIKNHQVDTVEITLANDDATLKLNGNNPLTHQTNAAPDNDGRDNLAPDQ
jgi:protein phosphatase